MPYRDKTNISAYYILATVFIFIPFYIPLRILMQKNLMVNSIFIGAWQDIVIIMLSLIMWLKLLDITGNNKRIYFGIAEFCFFLLILWAGLLLLVSDNIFAAAYVFRYSYLFMLLYFALTVINFSLDQLQKLNGIIMLTLIISALFGIIMYLLGGKDLVLLYQVWLDGFVPGIQGGYPRMGFTFGGCHNAAPAFILLTIMGVTEFIILKNKRGLFVSSLGLLALLLTFTRGALLGLFIGISMIMLAYFGFKIVANLRVITLLLTGLLFFAGILLIFPEARLWFVSEQAEDWRRPYQALRAIDESIEYPFGHGVGTAGAGLINISHIMAGNSTGDELSIEEAKDLEDTETNVSDNYYLKILFELGYLGLFFWGVGLVSLIVRLIYLFKREKDAIMKYFFGVALGYCTAISIYSLSSNQLETFPTKIYFWIIPAITLACYYNRMLCEQPN